MFMHVGTGDDSRLRQVAVPIVNWNTCRNLNTKYSHILTQNMICAGPMQGNRDSCSGDSGGPLVCKQGDRWFEYGIVSFGVTDLCATTNNPGVYDNVVVFLPWIQQQTGSQCRYYYTMS